MRSLGLTLSMALAACSGPPPAPVVTLASAAAPPAPVEARSLGQPCTADAECASGRCSDDRVCTRPCAVDGDCGGNLVCRSGDHDAQAWCSSRRGHSLGEACKVSSECAHNHCLHLTGRDDSAGICTRSCKAASDCPDTLSDCQAVSNSAATKLCVPGGSIGVPECDQYLQRYEACFSGLKIPAEVRPAMQQALDTQRDAFRKAAATPEGRAALASACKQASDALLAANPACK